ncbi:unnamed protein product [Cyprideis torosa]|uniref:Uncharacterized protein n=1 Tax=Cyprideis torosa TaxID=163714 RepID=A0A7R8ZNG5_9CRUS|nr:unnamed protein product [Cyprideis torosa]CAG0886300.1 unnamed protein product [Cyprideis torosa]
MECLRREQVKGLRRGQVEDLRRSGGSHSEWGWNACGGGRWKACGGGRWKACGGAEGATIWWRNILVILIAQARSIPCRCFVMNVTLDHAKHNNRFRDLTCSDHVAVGQMVFNTLKKTYQEPTLAEGFQEIVRVNFVPHFSSEADRKLYGSFLL